MRKALLLYLVIILCHQVAWGQCSVSSTDGYTVNISVVPTAIDAPATCDFGYNYDVVLDYDITFTGTSIPANMFTLQGRITCNTSTIFFDLPNTGGTGTFTTNGTPYTPDTDCATTTVAARGCNSVEIEIEGSGLPQQFVNCPIGPLPVELLSFTAIRRNDNVQLKWQTASETNNDFFNIERSEDGRHWQTLGKMDGAGNSSETLAYTWTDQSPLRGLSYYRLKQVDFDGRYAYSWVRSVAIEIHLF